MNIREKVSKNLKEAMIKKDTNLINTQIELYRSITREEIQAVAQKYLNSNQRLELEYLPERQTENPKKS